MTTILRALALLLLAGPAWAADVALVSVQHSAHGCNNADHIASVTAGNVQRQTTGTCSVGSGVITSATGFVAGDIGKQLSVHGCGAAGVALVGTITARTASSVTINVTASTAATGTTLLLIGGTRVITNDDDEEAVVFRELIKRQRQRPRTLAQITGHVLIKDVP